MSLSVTERDFLINNLGVLPQRGTFDLLNKAQDAVLNAEVGKYLEAEAALIKDIATLRGIAGTGPLVKTLDADFTSTQRAVQAAQRSGGVTALASGIYALSGLQARATTALANRTVYESLARVEGKLAALETHNQRAHVDAELKTARADVATARAATRDENFSDARKSLTAAEKACDDGKGFADRFAQFVLVKADALRAVGALKGVYSDAVYWQSQQDAALAAAAKGNADQRDYNGGETNLRGILATMKADIDRFYVTTAPAELKKLTDQQAKLQAATHLNGAPTVIDADIVRVRELQRQQKDAFDNGRLSEATMIARTELPNLVTTGVKVADRRLAYDRQRETTTPEVAALANGSGLRTVVALGTDLTALQGQLTTADGLASRASMRMEDGIAALRLVSTQCKAVIDDAVLAMAYLTERKAADARLAALKEQDVVKAGRVAALLTPIEAALAAATAASGIADATAAADTGAGMANWFGRKVDWAAAKKPVVQAVAGMAAAEALATGLADAVTLESDCAKAGDLPAVEKAIAALRQQVTAAGTQPGAAAAKEQFDKIEPALATALQEAKAGAFDKATAALKAASQALIDGRGLQAAQAAYDRESQPLAAGLDALTKLTDPPAAKLAGLTGPIKLQLEAAAGQAKAKDHAAAGATLLAAAAALDQAKAFADWRKAFDPAAEAIFPAVPSMMTASHPALEAAVTKARVAADALDRPQADALLKTAAAVQAKDTVLSKAATGALDADFDAALDTMLAAPDGAKLVDAMVKGLPDTVSPGSIKRIAQKRFNLELDVQGNAATKPVQSARKIFEMLALTPAHSKDSPSLQKVRRLTKESSGGYYASSGNETVMYGRPGDASRQAFGRTEINPNTGQPMLPPPLSAEYEPLDATAVEYFDFANVHETGHSVDDRLGYMAARAGQAAFGGWQSHGGAIKPIVDKVLATHGDGLDALLADYVRDLMGGATPDRPATSPTDESAMNAACDKIDAWYKGACLAGQCWWDQAKCAAIVLNDGRVYHEAYAKTWVSYPLAERSKGITGYQFRAPGEWFAELYAAYHLKKLKTSHPAVGWLSTL